MHNDLPHVVIWLKTYTNECNRIVITNIHRGDDAWWCSRCFSLTLETDVLVQQNRNHKYSQEGWCMMMFSMFQFDLEDRRTNATGSWFKLFIGHVIHDDVLVVLFWFGRWTAQWTGSSWEPFIRNVTNDHVLNVRFQFWRHPIQCNSIIIRTIHMK